jgi:hypothetical protein
MHGRKAQAVMVCITSILACLALGGFARTASAAPTCNSSGHCYTLVQEQPSSRHSLETI